jgi:hypothetical protein
MRSQGFIFNNFPLIALGAVARAYTLGVSADKKRHEAAESAMKLVALIGAVVLSAGGALAQAPATTLFENVMVFDGSSAGLTGPTNVLVEGNLITRVTDEPVAVDPATTTIAGEGRTLMPGLIDAHWHTMLIRPNPVQAIGSDVGYLNLLASVEADATLLRGFTTVGTHDTGQDYQPGLMPIDDAADDLNHQINCLKSYPITTISA